MFSLNNYHLLRFRVIYTKTITAKNFIFEKCIYKFESIWCFGVLVRIRKVLI